MLSAQILTNAQEDITTVRPLLMVVFVQTPLVHMSVLVCLGILVMEYCQEDQWDTMERARVAVSVWQSGSLPDEALGRNVA